MARPVNRNISPFVKSPTGYSAPGKVLAPAFYEKDESTGLPTGRTFDEAGNELGVPYVVTDAVTGDKTRLSTPSNAPYGVPPSLNWLGDTLHGLDIYSKGFVKAPTLFFDPSASTSLGRGTIRNPYATIAQLQNAINGNMAGHVLGFKRGTTIRAAAGTIGLNLNVYGTAAKPFYMVPYGDADALPIITGGNIITSWTLVDAGLNIWSYAMGATQNDVWQSNVRLIKKTWSVSAAATLTTEGTSTYNSNTLYIRPFGGANPADGTFEVCVVDLAMTINYTNVAATGNIIIAGLDVRKGRNSAFQITRPATYGTISSCGNISVVGCRASGGGVDTNASGLGRDALIIYGVTDAIRATDVYIAGNYFSDSMNNSVELAGVSGAIIEHNQSYQCHGHLIGELWSSYDACIMRYNIGTDGSNYGRVCQQYSPGGVYFAKNYWDGATWDTADATNAKNTTSIAHHNLIVRPLIRGFLATGGTGHKFQHNTVIFDGDYHYGAGVGSAEGTGWVTSGTAATGFVDISNNLFYWADSASARYPSKISIGAAGALGVGANFSVPLGDKNIYFTASLTANNANYYIENAFAAGADTTASFTTYKSTIAAGADVAARALDQNSFSGHFGGSANLTASQLLMDETTWRPAAAAIAGLTNLTGIGTRYQDGQPYVAASCTIGALLGS